MTDEAVRQIQREGAEALLDTGLSVPLKALRLPFVRKELKIRVTMRRPTLAGQMRIAREWLKMDVTSEQMWKFTHEEQMEFLANHGKGVSRMIAMTVCRGWWSRHLMVRPMAWAVRNWMDNRYLIDCMRKFVALMGTDPFIVIIRSAEAVNPMRLRLSREEKGS